MGAGTHTNTCNTLRAVKRATAPHGRAKALGIGWVACLTTTGVTTDAPNTSGNLMTRKQQPEPNQATGNGTSRCVGAETRRQLYSCEQELKHYTEFRCTT